MAIAKKSLYFPIFKRRTTIFIRFGSYQIRDLSKFVKLPVLEVLNQNSERVSLNDSTKRFQILSFFNNQCGDPCKALMHNLKWLDERFSDASNYRLTSLSTSTVDTPAVLLDYAKTNTIDLANRSLLYSTTEILNLVIKETLNTSLSEKQERVIYETLYLIDNQGYLRGIYDGTNTVDLENLILDSRIL